MDEHAENAEAIAQMLRANWSLPAGTVRKLMRAIEEAGGIVVKLPFATRDIDAISQWPSDMPPLFLVNSVSPPDRLRFSLAHELGHMVMHRAATETMELEADRFASAKWPGC